MMSSCSSKSMMPGSPAWMVPSALSYGGITRRCRDGSLMRGRVSSRNLAVLYCSWV
jgi:hypothetical protein